MRLLNIDKLLLESFIDVSVAPPYVILSHTWGDDEVTIHDSLFDNSDEKENCHACNCHACNAHSSAAGQSDARSAVPAHHPNLDTRLEALVGRNRDGTYSKGGRRKILKFCDAVQRKGLVGGAVRHVWVDTCCIDKTSSAELSEAINSMFLWYRQAVACFVFLEDVQVNHHLPPDNVGFDFEEARWFTRGWTLQELLAPAELYFYDKDWNRIGNKTGLAARISKRTNIDQDIILTGTWPHSCIAQRMSWAAHRQTTRKEDMAYCLLGIFDINMPLLYGEGDKAFQRLQEEILRESSDHSILAWDAWGHDDSIEYIGALASHPYQFRSCYNVEALPSDTNTMKMTHESIEASLHVVTDSAFDPRRFATAALLSCRNANDVLSRLVVPLLPIVKKGPVVHKRGAVVQYARAPAAPVSIANMGMFLRSPQDIALLKKDRSFPPSNGAIKRCWLHYEGVADNAFIPNWDELETGWVKNQARSLTILLEPQNASIETKLLVPSRQIRWDHYDEDEGRDIVSLVKTCVFIKLMPERLQSSVSIFAHVTREGPEEGMRQTMNCAQDVELQGLSSTLELEGLPRLRVRAEVLPDSYSTLEVAVETLK